MSERILTLVRHAKSSWRFRHLDDFRRPLNKRGLRDCVKMPRVLVKKFSSPQLVLCSDAVRAVQTCQALVDAFDVGDDRIVLDSELYLAAFDTLHERLRYIDDHVTHCMLIGHNPGLSDLCNFLLPSPIQDLPTMAVAVLKFDADKWAALRRGMCELSALYLPKELLKEL